MDNETPNYASWIPESGGYVSNGKVLSKSPVYDENGKLKLDVDVSQLQTAAPSQNTQVANNPISNVGITTANTSGSGEDANAMTTNIGSMGSLNLNTANPTESVISTPATKSPIAQEPILSVEDQINKDYQDAVARGDYQGMINALTRKGAIDGQDYSAEISRLTQAREQKIMGIDNQYLEQFNEARTAYQQAQSTYKMAVQIGDEAGAQQAQEQMNQAQAVMDQINTEQTAWRDSVGYESAMQSAYKRDMQDLEIKYKTTYMDGINNQIVPALLQLTNNYLNFQYDPTTDQKLIKAQDQVALKMRNLYNKTGMFYSTSSQYAITSALAELVPVYEQMAKDELKDSISMLQSTASFLLNLEESQFSMWKTQVQLQFDANAEKRAQFAQAVEASNARGYVTNEEAAILGVEPGSMSQQAREHMQELQEKLDEEQRALQQKMILTEYNTEMEKQLYADKAAIDAKYDAITYENRARISAKYGTSSSGLGSSTQKYNGMTATQYRDYMVSKMNNGELNEQQMRETVNSTTFSSDIKDAIINEALDKTKANSGEVNFNRPLTGSLSQSALSKLILDYDNAGMTEDTNLINVLDDLLLQGKDYDSVLEAISNTKVDLGGGVKEPVFDTTLLLSLPGTSQQKLENYQKYYQALYASVDEDGLNVPQFKRTIQTADDIDNDTKIIFYQRAMDTYNNDGTRK